MQDYDFIGVNADGIPQYFSTVNSATLYVATINITENTLYGQWRISIESEGFFTVKVLGNSELIISTQTFTSGPNGGEDIGDPKPLESKVQLYFTTFINVCINRLHNVC